MSNGNIYPVMSAIFLAIIIMGGVMAYAPAPSVMDDGKVQTSSLLLGKIPGLVTTEDSGQILIQPYIPISVAEPAQPRTMSISGTGTLSTNPDQAVIVLGVYTEGKSANDAMQENADIMSKVIDAISVYKFQFQTTSYTIYPVYSYDAKMVVSYQVTNTLQITVTDLTKIGAVIDSASSAGANSVSSVTFSLSNAKFDSLKSQAYEMAIADVKAKAKVLSEGFGFGILGVQSISESYYSPPMYRNSYAGMDVKSQTPIVSGTLDLTVSLSVVYSID